MHRLQTPYFVVLLASIFKTAFGATGVPEVGLFTCLQKRKPKVSNEVFNSDEFIRLREEMLLYYTDAKRHSNQEMTIWNF